MEEEFLKPVPIFRLATSYISHLKRMLSDEEDEDRRSDDAGSDLKRRDGGLTLSLVSNVFKLLGLKR